MRDKKKQKRDPAKTREKILMAAESEFSEKGYYGGRIDVIASRAGVNKRMIYEYYGNKQELYKTIFVYVYTRLGEGENKILTSETDCVKAIKKIIAFYFEYLAENPSYINLLLQENLNKGKAIKNMDFSKIRDSGLKNLRKHLEDGKKQGIFRKDISSEDIEISILLLTFANFSNKYTFFHLIKKDFLDPKVMKKRLKHVTDLFLRYLLV
ncbi:MAG: TetR family transcriptional regulator [Treponema sp.]|jgi:TetR/AcrR family transcriptional regulator|nr:TetR family transcriptional regulator [Treponema sp.]